VTDVLTVAGTALRPHYDTVLAHEHLRIDIRCWLDETHEPSRHLRDLAVDAGTVEGVRTNPFSCLDNLLLDDAALIAEELERLRGLGATLIVDVTPANVGRDTHVLARLSQAAGVDVVCGCGRYIAESRPDDDPAWPPEHYRDEILAELEGPVPRPAVIGEIGTGDPILPIEATSLTGAAMAQARSGRPLYVHLHPWARHGHAALDLVEQAGGDLRATVLCHLDAQIPGGLDHHRSLMDRGATIAFDIWGDELPYGHVRMPTDDERIAATVELVAGGYGDRLVHAHDVCTKTQLHRFGGAGFDHLPRVVAPRLRAAGLSEQEVHRQLAGNALRLIASTERNG
jgi:phosphotriesterase-related protein